MDPAPARYGIAALYRELWRLAKGCRTQIVGAFGLLLGSQLFRLAVPWLTAQAIDAVQRGGLEGVGTAGRWLLAGFLATAASWALHGPGRVLERNVALHARRRLSDELVNKLFALPLAWHDRHHSGETVQRMRQCTGALYDFAQSQFIYLQNAARLVGPVIALCLIDLRVGALAIVGYLLIAAVIVAFDRRMIALAHRENDAERRHAAIQLDAFGSIGTVHALRMSPGLARLIDERLAAIFAPLRRAIALNEWKWCSVDLLAAGLALGLVALYAAILVAGGAGAPGDPALPIGRLFMVYEYAAQAGGVITALGAHLQGFARQRADFAAGDAIRFASADAGAPDGGAPMPAPADSFAREGKRDGASCRSTACALPIRAAPGSRSTASCCSGAGAMRSWGPAGPARARCCACSLASTRHGTSRCDGTRSRWRPTRRERRPGCVGPPRSSRRRRNSSRAASATTSRSSGAWTAAPATPGQGRRRSPSRMQRRSWAWTGRMRASPSAAATSREDSASGSRSRAAWSRRAAAACCCSTSPARRSMRKRRRRCMRACSPRSRMPASWPRCTGPNCSGTSTSSSG